MERERRGLGERGRGRGRGRGPREERERERNTISRNHDHKGARKVNRKMYHYLMAHSGCRPSWPKSVTISFSSSWML